MRKIFPFLILLLLFLSSNVSFAQEGNFTFEIGGVYPFGSGVTLLLPYGEMSFSQSLFSILRLEASLDIILILIIPIFSPSVRIALELPYGNNIPYLGVGTRNFIVWGEEAYVSPFVAEVFVGAKMITRRGLVTLWELIYITSTQIFTGQLPPEGFFVGRIGIEF
ncbi:MAG: hypothetical protein NZ841_06070 [Dictyoglomus sp.]|nr:hypothetical protein [Dictyoglomus sp.]MDW8188844.1 hypothetical protein [Dictyoglomus sp.]